MNALLMRLLLAASLAMVPALSFAASHEEEKSAETTSKTSTEEDADEEDAAEEETAATDEELDEEQKALAEKDDEWAKKLRKRHHEGDVALGVCGARMTALMWFYQASVADGRDDLESAYDAIRESRTILKDEAERRAVEDGVGTSVSVMNEYSAELWDELVTASEEPETFQKVHDDLFADVQECLTMFFRRGKTVKKAADVDAGEGAEDDGAEDEKTEEETAD